MARAVTSETPAVVAQRMSDLILCFPSAVTGGVQWETLIRKYNERHSAKLGTVAFGHCSPLSTATALLWDVLRLVDVEDTDNPVVAVEDCVALTAKPDACATWPSLYQALCNIAIEHGAQEEAYGDKTVNTILVSQLKPLLQRHWHSNFDEGSLSYFTDEGTPVRVKKMKHLLQALLRWREDRMAWRYGASAGTSPLDAALELELEIVPSKKHNDLLLRCVHPRTVAATLYTPSAWEWQYQPVQNMPQTSPWSDVEDAQSITDSSIASDDLMDEIATLRAENARMRGKQSQDERLQKALVEAELMADCLDNPSEPPPFEYWGNVTSPSCSTAASSDIGFGSDCATPRSVGSGSGSATPTAFVMANQGAKACTILPMWFAMGDRVGIPHGVVQQACAIYECHTSLPSFFVQQ